jgi:hypothetical protein
VAFGDHSSIEPRLGSLRVNPPHEPDIHLREMGMIAVGRTVIPAAPLRRDVQRRVRIRNFSKVVVPQRPPQLSMQGAPKGIDEVSFIERHALCIGSHPAGCQLSRADRMDCGTYSLGTLDEESAQ